MIGILTDYFIHFLIFVTGYVVSVSEKYLIVGIALVFVFMFAHNGITITYGRCG